MGVHVYHSFEVSFIYFLVVEGFPLGEGLGCQTLDPRLYIHIWLYLTLRGETMLLLKGLWRLGFWTFIIFHALFDGAPYLLRHLHWYQGGSNWIKEPLEAYCWRVCMFFECLHISWGSIALLGDLWRLSSWRSHHSLIIHGCTVLLVETLIVGYGCMWPWPPLLFCIFGGLCYFPPL